MAGCRHIAHSAVGELNIVVWLSETPLYVRGTPLILHVKVKCLVTENVKVAIELHHGKCRIQGLWSLMHIRDLRSRYFCLCSNTFHGSCVINMWKVPNVLRCSTTSGVILKNFEITK